MSILTQASHQWSSRPADERYTSLVELRDYSRAVREGSRSVIVPSRKLFAHPDGVGEGSSSGLLVSGPNGAPTAPTHWSFGQLASLAGAPGSYLRSLPSEIAADCINWGLRFNREIEDVGILLTKNGGSTPILKAATGPRYGRIWNADILDRLVRLVGDGVTGQWKVPGEFGLPVPVTQANTTIYGSDRDCFVFLCDEKNLIEVPGAGRDGGTELLARGFFVWNSEVGAKTFGISTFFFRYVCCNRIVWGAKDVSTVTIRHSASAPERFIEEAAPALEAYSQSTTNSIVEAVQTSRAARIKEEVPVFLAKRFGKGLAARIIDVHQAEEGRPIETLWDAAQGVTAVARTVRYTDDRVDLERQAGELIDLAA